MIFEDGIIRTPDLKFDEKCGGIGKVLYEYCKIYHNRTAVINTVTDEWDTYSGLLSKCMATASALRKRGLQPQNIIALCSNNENINASIPLIAAQFLGCISFSVDPGHTVEECAEFFEQIPPKIVFTTAQSKDVISKALKRLGIDVEIIVFGEQFKKEFLENKEQFLPIDIEDLSTTSMIHFSSGSTGTPKAICLSHYYFLALQVHRKAKEVEPNHHQLNNHPLSSMSLKYTNWYWVSSTMDLIINISIGGCRLLRDQFDPQEFWRSIEKYRVTDVFLVPLQCLNLSESVKPENLDVSSLLSIIIGSYMVHNDIIYKLREMLPNAIISHLYGMTECGVVTLFKPFITKSKELLTLKPHSCGNPVNGLYYKVIDLETGKKCGPNQQGEFYLKGTKIFRCFYNKDASVSFDEEGFFKSGDLVYFDEDFCFYILDRIKNVLRWNDHTIFLYHVERVLLSHPAVNNAIVIGIPNKREGERMMGVVQLKEDADVVTEEELVNYVNQRVEDHKRLREGVTFVNNFPTTITGKLNRPKLKQTILKNLKI
ncbi:luciferin 4-monooxygenase-like isoform X2 [Euwallacea fornicatus]|uniref:luciferin 4-monooxygenase-like isoform X2 n=1 Tax=Euwallacea fornicatus TaxID=995702 RepID=UPI0033906F56